MGVVRSDCGWPGAAQRIPMVSNSLHDITLHSVADILSGMFSLLHRAYPPPNFFWADFYHNFLPSKIFFWCYLEKMTKKTKKLPKICLPVANRPKIFFGRFLSQFSTTKKFLRKFKKFSKRYLYFVDFVGTSKKFQIYFVK